jgi:hypothetical protein
LNVGRVLKAQAGFEGGGTVFRLRMENRSPRKVSLKWIGGTDPPEILLE